MAKRQKYILDDGREMVFSTEKFREALYKYQLHMKKNGAKLSRENIIEKLSEECHTSYGAIIHWIKGHNGPSDLEKVESLAKALCIKTNDLLENENESSEEITNMNSIITENKIDYSSTKSVVHDLYTEMVGYIEMYRTVRDWNYKMDSSVLKPIFRNLYISLMKAKLNLPRKVFEELRSFAANYLQQMMCYLAYEEFAESDDSWIYDEEEYETLEKRFVMYERSFIPDDYTPWTSNEYFYINFDSEDAKLFKETVAKEEKYYDDVEWDKNGESEFFISQAAYKRLDEILKDYMPD